MSKRRINKQQSARINKIQQSYQDTLREHLMDGLVLTRFSKHVEIEDLRGKIILCSIRPNLETLVAGDRIIWQAEGNNQGVVVSLCPRTSILARPSSSGLEKPVAANITQMIVVIAPKPEISWPLLDSYLIMAQLLKLQVIILLNKVDLPCDEIRSQLKEDYQSLGYRVIEAGKNLPQNNAELNEALNHQVSVFVGQSGVGKSSLIAQILPHEKNISTNILSIHSELGQHTTSNSRYYHLVLGGALIDSPGVREFSLGQINAAQIAQGYLEFQPYLSLCKFRNCSHINTPHCGIIEALSKGLISEKRYDNFVRLCNLH